MKFEALEVSEALKTEQPAMIFSLISSEEHCIYILKFQCYGCFLELL